MSPREQAMARLCAPGAPFETRLEDVGGEELEVFAHRHRSLVELLAASATFGETDYLVTERGRLSFAEHHAQVAALATALREEHGVRPGDRVAVCAANCPEWVVAFWATVSLGAVAVAMNSMWAGPELAHALALTGPRVVVADAARRALLPADLAELRVVSLEDDLPALVERHRGVVLPMPERAIDEDDPAVILFTSGTTGRAKGATHSHRNVIAAIWFHLLNDAVAAELGHPQRDRRFLLLTPLFHISGLHNLALVRLAVGDTAVLHLGRFDVDRVLRLIERERVTNWGAVPTMLARVVELGDRLAEYDLGSLRTVSVNSAPSSPELKERLRRALPVAGRSLGTSYGMTESSTGATLATADDLAQDPETVGRPVATLQLEVRDELGRRVPDGTEGEVCLRGAQMMLGYWGDPEATRRAFAPHRWYRSGDLGTIVDGRLRISSRRSDLILRGGENVYPAEVEDRLCTHPGVRECVVLAVPDDDLGQAVAAVVVLRDPSVDEAQLRAHAAAGLGRYKVPTHWVLTTTALPRNATGKVIRAQVGLG